MKNKTLATWIIVTGIITSITAFLDMENTVIGLFMITFTVFTFMGAYRLNKIGDQKQETV